MSIDVSESSTFLDSVEGEIAFFRSVTRARPVGIHRFFHVLTIRNAILKDTGKSLHIDALWSKICQFWDVDALEAIDIDADGYESSTSSNSTPISIADPLPNQNLSMHPFFREEFSLPFDSEEQFEAIIAARRIRSTVSPVPSPALSSSNQASQKSKKRKKGKSRADMAGLVAGDSDSSALTQESGDEGDTTRGSVITGTDGGTEDQDIDEDDIAPLAEMSPAPKKPVKGTKKATRGARSLATASSNRPPLKKRKR